MKNNNTFGKTPIHPSWIFAFFLKFSKVLLLIHGIHDCDVSLLHDHQQRVYGPDHCEKKEPINVKKWKIRIMGHYLEKPRGYRVE